MRLCGGVGKGVGMKPEVYISEVIKHMKLTGATDADLQRVTGWSKSTMSRRFKNPGQITLKEASDISEYLGINQRR